MSWDGRAGAVLPKETPQAQEEFEWTALALLVKAGFCPVQEGPRPEKASARWRGLAPSCRRSMRSNNARLEGASVSGALSASETMNRTRRGGVGLNLRKVMKRIEDGTIRESGDDR